MKFDTPWFSDTDEAVLTEPEVATDELTASGFSLILYNDDVNTFDFVIKTTRCLILGYSFVNVVARTARLCRMRQRFVERLIFYASE